MDMLEGVLLLTVKCEWQETNAAFHAEDLVHYWVARRYPTDPGKVSQRWKDEVWEPVPDKRR
jgi:hypothetical protein